MFQNIWSILKLYSGKQALQNQQEQQQELTPLLEVEFRRS